MKTARISARPRLGFTLVELMVVVAVIGILSAIVYANFGATRAIARDNIRKTDLKDLQVAIELYKAQNGEYPDRCSSGTTWSGSVKGTAKCTDGTTEYIKGLVPDFIAVLPVDSNASKNTGNDGYLYTVVNVGGKNTEYKVMANNTVEKIFITSYSDEFARCPAKQTAGACKDLPSDPLSTFDNNTYAIYKGDTVDGW